MEERTFREQLQIISENTEGDEEGERKVFEHLNSIDEVERLAKQLKNKRKQMDLERIERWRQGDRNRACQERRNNLITRGIENRY